MKRKSILSTTLIVLAAFYALNLEAQSDESFKPYFKPNVLIFTDVNSTITKDGASNSFNVKRAYLGFEYFFSKKISSRINVDIADPGVGKLQMTAFIKYAYLQYKTDKFTTRFGMIATNEFNLQEKIWGYRYILKSFQDEYGMGPSADLGASFEYIPSKFLSVDFSLLNGEGYKKLQADSSLKATIGVTVRPVEGLMIRGYYDMMKHNYNQNTLSLFAGYTYKIFRAGIEYNNQNNSGMLSDQNFSGVSAYAAAVVAKKYSVFARYDNLKSKVISGEPLPWNYGKDGQLFMAGFDYNPTPGVKIAPNFQGWSPRDKSKPFASTIGLNFEIKF